MKILNKFIWSKKEPSNKNDIWFDGSTWRMYTEEAWQSFTLPVDAADKVAKVIENASEVYQEKLNAGYGIIIEGNTISVDDSILYDDSDVWETIETLQQNKVEQTQLNDYVPLDRWASTSQVLIENISELNSTKLNKTDVATINGQSLIEGGNIVIDNTEIKQQIIELFDKTLQGKQDTIEDLETIRSGAAKGATAAQNVSSSNANYATVRREGFEWIISPRTQKISEAGDPVFYKSGIADAYDVKQELIKKVDKVVGKQLSTEDFTTALKQKLQGLSNYDDSTLTSAINSLQSQINTLVSGNVSSAIDTFNEIIAFLDGVKDTQDLAGIIASIEQLIAGVNSSLSAELAKKPNKTDIATINGQSLIEGGNITIEGRNYDAEIATLQQKDTQTETAIARNTAQITQVSGDVGETIAKLTELSEEILRFQVEGNDTTLVFSDIKRNIVPGHRYRLTIKNPDIDMSGVGQLSVSYIRLSILSYDEANNRTKLIIEIPVTYPLQPFYDVTLPENSKGLGIAIRATKGKIFEAIAEDVTISLTNAEKLTYEDTGEVPKGNLNPGYYGASLNAFSYNANTKTWFVPVKAGKLYHVKGKTTSGNMRLYDNAGKEIQKDSKAYFGETLGENLKMPLEYGEGLHLQFPVSIAYGEKPEDIQLYEDIALPQMPIEGDFSLDMESVEYDGKVGLELQATKFAEIYSRYDALVSAYPNNMSKKLLGYGTATDGSADTTLPIYEYTFAPLVGNGRYSLKYEGEIPFPNYTKKIILTSGVHGREKISVEAVYKFMENVCKGEKSQFASLASNFVIKVIPLVNPFSYDDFSRLNKRGVNINRNLGHSWDNQDIHDATDKGSAAYSEKESQILRDWLRENSDAILYVDAHDSMYASETTNVAAYIYGADEAMQRLGASHIKVESRKIWNDNSSLAKKIYGYVANQRGAMTYWEGVSVGIKASSTIEINDFFNGEMFNQYAIELHCWAVYNWILANIQYVLKK